MGFFKDIREISQKSREIGSSYDVTTQARGALERMQHANALMASMAQQPAATPGSGAAAIATITAVRTTGTLVNTGAVLEFDLLVMVPGHPPLPLTRQDLVPQHLLAGAREGARVNARYDGANGAITLDWSTPVTG